MSQIALTVGEKVSILMGVLTTESFAPCIRSNYLIRWMGILKFLKTGSLRQSLSTMKKA